MKAKRLLASVLSLSMAAGMLAGCGNAATGGGTSGGGAASTAVLNAADAEKTANLRISWWGGDSRHQATQAAIDAFMEKYPDIKVDVEFGAWTDWEANVATQLMSGTAPDVMQINWNWIASYSPDGSAFYDLNKASDILDLTQFKEDDLAKCEMADSLQAVPISMTGRIFYWNKTTFDKAGIATPTSLEELMAAGETFKTKIGENAYPLCLNELDRTILMVFYLESKYGKDWVSDNKLNYSKEEIQEGLEFIKSLEDGHVIPTLKKLKGDGADSLDKNENWINGNYAGIFEWDSSATKFVKAADGQEIVVGDYFKDMGEHQGGFAKVSMGFAISSNSKYPAQAALLIQYLLNDEEGAKLMGSERGIPASAAGLKVCEDNDLIDPMVKEANDKVMSWVQYNLDPKFEDNALKADPDGTYYKVMSRFSYGEEDASAAADELMNGINEVLGS